MTVVLNAKFKPKDRVFFKASNPPYHAGTILQYNDTIDNSEDQTWYKINWDDGVTSINPESELLSVHPDFILPLNKEERDILISACGIAQIYSPSNEFLKILRKIQAKLECLS
jgi:hypothetical protein